MCTATLSWARPCGSALVSGQLLCRARGAVRRWSGDRPVREVSPVLFLVGQRRGRRLERLELAGRRCRRRCRGRRGGEAAALARVVVIWELGRGASLVQKPLAL